jgi:hypothetical protein
MFGTIPGNPLAPRRPDKVAGTERVQREDPRDKAGNGRGKSPRKRSQDDGGPEDTGPEKPGQVGKRLDVEA